MPDDAAPTESQAQPSAESPAVVEFTTADANALIELCNSAPLQNMRHAAAVSQLLQRFNQWYRSTLITPTAF